MDSPSAWEALRPLANRNGRIVREHEILRASLVLRTTEADRAIDLVSGEVLTWAQKRAGAVLPVEAWDRRSFQSFSGGRNSVGIRLKHEDTDLWAIRVDDPDKNVPGRTWTNEVVVGCLSDQLPRFSVRQLVSTVEEDLIVEPHVPGFVQQIADTCGIWSGPYRLEPEPRLIDSDDEAELLVDMMVDADRSLPLFLVTLPEDLSSPHLSQQESERLARAVLGIGHVYTLPARYTWALTERFGKQKSVFGGASRVYLPGFTEQSSPYDHRLFLAEQFYTQQGRASVGRWLRSMAAAESLRSLRLGAEVLAFSAIQNATTQLHQANLDRTGASLTDKLQAARARIESLERQLEDEKASSNYYSSEHDKIEDRAKAAEEQLRASAFRIQQLVEQLREQGAKEDSRIEIPDNWADFANWCDVNFAGRVVLTPAARRGVRDPEFEDLALAARCLIWLANEGRTRRMEGGEGSLRDEFVEDGIRNAHCGSDAFDFKWQGRNYEADWHIKNGGNTRDPSRCLRIYYSWDSSTQQILIAEMPAHRRTGAT